MSPRSPGTVSLGLGGLGRLSGEGGPGLQTVLALWQPAAVSPQLPALGSLGCRVPGASLFPKNFIIR